MVMAMVKQISLRLPDELHDELKAAADDDERSIHAEVLWAIRIMLRNRKQPMKGE